MSQLRYNLISHEWVIIATDRAKRPRDFSKASKEKGPLEDYKEDCPFCPGHEDKTPQETFRLGNKNKWKVRATYNKFAALSPQEGNNRMFHGTFSSLDGFGYHEVIIDHPSHKGFIPLLRNNEVSDIIKTYRSRYRSLQDIERIEAIIIFKNHGPEAGTSLEHPHSQLIATPIVPPQVRNRFKWATDYFDQTGKCIFCQTLKEELKAKKRIVLETAHFVAFIPFAAISPFHMWIFPRRHCASFVDISDKEIRDLSVNLKATISKLYYGLFNPDYNYTIHSAPVRESSAEHFHWYMSVIPRVSKIAGFELGSGIFINVALPEHSARFLRNVKIKEKP